MKWFLGTYASLFNRRHKLFGHLFSGCYKALIVEGSGTGYLQTVRRGWFLGGAESKEQLVEQMGQGVGEHHEGEEKRETDEQKAGRIIGKELRKRRCSEADLKQRRKTDALKVQIAARLRRETVQTLDWIDERLRMGCRHKWVTRYSEESGDVRVMDSGSSGGQRSYRLRVVE